MANDRVLLLRQTTASGPIVPTRIAQAFSVLARTPGAPPSPRGGMHGQVLRLSISLSLEDDACAAFLLDFMGQGDRVKGNTRGASEPLLAWAFYAIAATIKCTLEEDDAPVAPAAEPHRDAAIAYLSTYEDEVRGGATDGTSFLRWLSREGHIVLSGDPSALGAELPMEAPAALYEMLLDADGVDEVFASEREVAALLARFHARALAR
jgi:hypothetical protein